MWSPSGCERPGEPPESRRGLERRAARHAEVLAVGAGRLRPRGRLVLALGTVLPAASEAQEIDRHLQRWEQLGAASLRGFYLAGPGDLEGGGAAPGDSQQEPPEPDFSTTEARLHYLRWLGTMSDRLRRRKRT